MEENIRVIKRYSNRKLYDMSDSRYITLEKIAEFVRAGQEIRVIDNQSQEDLTAVILSQILFEQEKRKRGGFLPISTLQSILQSGEEVYRKKIAKPVKVASVEAEKKVGEWVSEAERTFTRMVRKGAELDAHAVDLRNAIGDTLQKRLEEFTASMEARVRTTTDAVNQLASSLTEVDVLRKRIDDLEKSMRKLSPSRSKKGKREKKDPSKV
jgi:polyhydroxyalkanoate synthesis repressor PhaR